MQAKSCLSLKNYVVKTMMFSLNESFNFNLSISRVYS